MKYASNIFVAVLQYLVRNTAGGLKKGKKNTIESYTGSKIPVLTKPITLFNLLNSEYCIIFILFYIIISLITFLWVSILQR